MPTLIDALVATFTIDASGAKKGAREAGDAQRRVRDDAEKTRKAYEEAGKRISQSINSARNAALGLFGVMTAGRGINSLVSETTRASAALGRMARDLNVSTEALSAYEGMSRQVGNSAGQVTSALEATQNQIQQFRLLGASMPGLPIFRSLGISLADARGNARSTTDIYNDVLNALHRRPAQERATLAAGLGYGQETVNLAALPAERRNQMLAEARRDSPTRASADAAARREAAWVRLDRVVMRVTDQLLLAMTPTLEFVVEQLGRLATFLGEHALTAFQSIESAIRRFAGYIGSQDFQDDMAAFIGAIRDASVALLDWLRWLGILPGEAAAATPQGERVIGPDGTSNWVRTPSGEVVASRHVAPSSPAAQAAIAAAGAGGAGEVIGATERQQQALSYFQSRGWSREQAAAIVGNMMGESQSLDVGAFNPAGGGQGAQGINQWRGPRVDAFRARYGHDPRGAPLAEQLEFTDWELRNSHRAVGDALRNTTDARVGADLLHRRYSIPGSEDRSGPRRQANALRVIRDAEAAAAAPAAPPMSPAEQAAAALGVRVGPPPTPDPGLVPGADGAALRDNVRPNQTSSNEANIGTVNVVTQATDAGGIARDIGAALSRITFVDQATRGLA